MTSIEQEDLFPDLDVPECSDGRVCSKCGIKKPNDDFSYCSGGNYYRPECRQCNRELTKIRKELRDKHGNAPPDYHCPVCGLSTDEVEGKGGSAGAWVLDHCHETNTFRGWLCHMCNRALGCFGDDMNRMQRAINYLKRHKDEISS